MSASLGMTYIGLGGRDTVNSLLEEWGEGHRQFLIGGMGGRDTVNSLYRQFLRMAPRLRLGPQNFRECRRG